MSKAIQFYTHFWSRGRTVRWMLEELGEPYEAHILNYGPEMKSPPYTDLNPMGKVPTIVHDGEVITEVAAILVYLADAFPQKGLNVPVGAPGRGSYLRWLFFAAGPVAEAMTAASFKLDITPKLSGQLGFGSVGLVVDTLERVLSGQDYLAAGRFTAADLFMAASLNFAMSFGMFEKREALTTYVARHTARPAAIRAAEIDDALGDKTKFQQGG